MNAFTQYKNEPYSLLEWNNYARLFASITTSVQMSVYMEACQYLQGDVIDCGCGTAKIAPFLLDNIKVKSYLGVDYSADMIEVSKWVVSQLHNEHFNVIQSRIEDYEGQLYDSAISVQSYYSWPEPLKILQHIYNLLKPKGIFVLATANANLPIDALARDAWKELLTHPDFEAYKAYNVKLATNPDAHFVSLDDLVKQVSQVGFILEKAHQQHFQGGLNFLVLSKKS